MGKKISVTDWLLLGLGGFIDFINEIRDPFGLLSSFYQQTYGFVPLRFRRTNIYHSIWRKLKTGDIKKIKAEGKNYMRLTLKGLGKIKKRFPILFESKKAWDGFFRVVVYDISEETRKVRDRFRWKLKQLGFGLLQKSVWISPHDFLKELKEFLKINHLDKKILILQTKNFYVNNLKEFAKEIWPLGEINEKYKKIYKDLLKFKSLKRKHDRTILLNKIRQDMISVYFEDPFLPREFLPKDWTRNKVIRIIKKLKIFSL